MTSPKLLKQLVSWLILLTLKAFNEVYSKYFTSKPARSCVAVKDLPLGALVEVEIIAEV